MKNRIISLLLALVLLFSLVPMHTFAQDSDLCPVCGEAGCVTCDYCSICKQENCNTFHEECPECGEFLCSGHEPTPAATELPTQEPTQAPTEAVNPAAEEDDLPDYSAQKGKFATVNSAYPEDLLFAASAQTPTEQSGADEDTIWYYTTDFSEDILFEIKDTLVLSYVVTDYDEELGENVEKTELTLWYQVNVIGGTPPVDDPDNGIVAFRDGFWIMQNYLNEEDAGVNPDVLTLSNRADHTWCDTCGKYDCGQSHEDEDDEPPTLENTQSGISIFGEEEFPAGAKLEVAPVSGAAQLDKFKIPESKKVFALDISIQVDGVTQQPSGGVAVQIPVSAAPGTKIGLLHTHNGVTTYLGMTTVENDGTIMLYTDKFSEFVGFTVDFHYGGVDYSIAGMSSILLSELFERVNISKDATAAKNVVFSDPSLLTVTEQEDGDWLLTSLKMFSTEETLLITFDDGEVMVIDVTDAAHNSANDPVSTGGPATANGYKIFSAVSDINANWSVVSGGSNWITVYLYGTDGNLIDYSFFKKHPAALGWLSFTSSKYWFKVGSYDFASGNPSRPSDDDIDTIRMGGMGTAEWYNIITGKYQARENSINVHMYSTDVWYNADYCDVNQVSKFANYSGETGNRTTIIYAYNANTGRYEEVGRSTVLFPTFQSMTASDLNVTAYKGWNVANKTVENGNYAVYLSPNTYTVAYNGNGATSGSMATSTHYYGTDKALTANGFSKTGYSFAGWATSSTGAVVYSNGQTVKNLTTTNNATVTLYAKWNPIQYSVEFDGNGATGGSMTNQTFAYDTPQALKANGFTKAYTVTYDAKGGSVSPASATANATFNGWEDRGSIVYNGTNYPYTTFDAPYYANTQIDVRNAYGYNKYGLISHWVTYVVNGTETRAPTGNAPGIYPPGATVSNLTTTNGDTVTLRANWTLGSVTLPTPTAPAGYTFGGWKTGSSTYAAGATYTPTANVTMTAIWNPISYTITYNLGGGTNHASNPGSYTVESGDITLQNPTPPEGYTFGGWQEGNTIAAGSTGNKTFTAIWNMIGYPVTFDANGGTGAPDDQVKTHGTALTLSATEPTRNGFVFMGWAESADATAVAYAPGAQYTRDEPVTLYAVWGYSVTVNCDDGAEVTSTVPTKVLPGEEITVAFVPRDGYLISDFVVNNQSYGTHFDNAEGGSLVVKINQNTVIAITSQTIKYDINYIFDNGTNEYNTVNYYVNAGVSLAEKPEYDGYEFKGWVVKEASGNWQAGETFAEKQVIQPGRHGNVTLLAQWERAYADLTIAIDGAVSGNNYQFSVLDKNGVEVARVILHDAKRSVVVKGLALDVYTVKPLSGWNWRQKYTVANNGQINLNVENTVTFTWSANGRNRWLNGYNYGAKGGN